MPHVLSEGSQLNNRYQVVKILDVSPLRNIYLVRDVHLRGNTWVIKQMLPTGSNSGGSQKMRQRFEQEARHLSSIEHPSIPRILDFFVKDQCFYLVREYIPGTDLGTLVTFQGGRLAEEDALRLTVPIAELLGFLYRKEVGPSVYRELALGSLIVTPEGEVRLVDFGFSRLFGKANSLGPVDYAAPEQFSGEETDARTLVYNLGAIIYHLISGENPGDSPFNLEPLEELAPRTTDPTLKLVEKALQNKPGARFATPEAMLKQIQKARRSLAKKGKKSSPGGGNSSGTQRLEGEGLTPVALLIAIAAILVVGFGGFAVYEYFLKGLGN